MKYVYSILIVALILGAGYLAYDHQQKAKEAASVPAGFHRMSDGTLMRNEVMPSTPAPEASAPQEAMNSQQSASQEVDQNAHVIEVKAHNYAFDTDEIRVKKGETVTINFESTDGFHDWAVDEFNAQTQKVQPGTKTSVTFVADKEGTFEYYCSVGNHRAMGMVGKLIVE